jgi:hypothetical protein
MEASGQLYSPTALPSEKNRGTKWIGGWVSPRAGLGGFEEEKITCLPAGMRTLGCRVRRVLFDVAGYQRLGLWNWFQKENTLLYGLYRLSPSGRYIYIRRTETAEAKALDSCTGPMVIYYDPTATDDIYCRCSSTVTALLRWRQNWGSWTGWARSFVLSVCIAYCYLETISIRET